MDENIILDNKEEKPVGCVLVGIITEELDERACAVSLDELARLADTAGAACAARLTQARPKPDPATCIGSGKLEELRTLCVSTESELVIFDNELSPSQIKNIEKALGDNARVIDRTMLILDIFAKNARTAEGILQVEIAGLRYSLPRLSGKGSELSRLGGGIGTRGPGESKLESDRRHIARKMQVLESELRELEKNRSEQRKSRRKKGTLQIAIAGYTNAGKSTLLNYLTDAGILAEDKLFATLDPTTRRLTLPNAGEVLITDTVGFINRLPHHLVKAFRSTLDEVAYADLILVLLDLSDDEVEKHYRVTQKILADLFAERSVEPKPMLFVFNKCDTEAARRVAGCPTDGGENVYISAKTGQGVEKLLEKIEEILLNNRRTVRFCFPASCGAALSQLYKSSAVISVDYRDNATVVEASVDRKTEGQLRQYIEKE